MFPLRPDFPDAWRHGELRVVIILVDDIAQITIARFALSLARPGAVWDRCVQVGVVEGISCLGIDRIEVLEMILTVAKTEQRLGWQSNDSP